MKRNTIYHLHVAFIEEYQKQQRLENIKALLNVYNDYLMRINDVDTLSEIAMFILTRLYATKEGRELIEQIR